MKGQSVASRYGWQDHAGYRVAFASESHCSRWNDHKLASRKFLRRPLLANIDGVLEISKVQRSRQQALDDAWARRCAHNGRSGMVDSVRIATRCLVLARRGRSSLCDRAVGPRRQSRFTSLTPFPGNVTAWDPSAFENDLTEHELSALSRVKCRRGCRGP